MHQLIILSSLAVVILTYLYISLREHNYVNVLTPFVLLGVPSWYLLELAYGALAGFDGSVFAYFYCYLTYAMGVVGTAVGYLVTPAKPLSIFVKFPKVRVPGLAFIFLGFALLLYAPILIRFPHLLVSPRQIYELTRSGFGIQFFLSSFAVYLGFVFLLFSSSLRRPAAYMFLLVSLAVLYLHGSKGQVLFFFLIGLYFFVFVKGWRFGLQRLIVLGTVVSVMVIGLFYVTFSESAKADLAISIAGYADYTRNAAMVIDDDALDPQMGRLTLEGRLYTIVPRALVPDKPNDYGAFWLVKRYFPGRFDLGTGAPDMGLGVQYADFGILTVVYCTFWAVLTGFAMKVLVTRLKHDPDAGSFMLLLVLMQVPLIPTGGGGVPLVVYFVIAHFVKSLGRDLPKRGTEAVSPAMPMLEGQIVSNER